MLPLTALLVVLLSLVAEVFAAAGRRPNIIFALLDDVGYEDFSFGGGFQRSETPTLASLAATGMVLTNAYSSNPLCSPSRASALTGRLPIRNGFYTSTWFGRNGYTGQGVAGGISDSEVLLQEQLKNAGYSTFLAGKNHLGCPGNISYAPRGWTEWTGTCDVHFRFGGSTGLPNLAMMANGSMVGRVYDSPEFAINLANQTGNITQYYTAAAVDFIERHAGPAKPPIFLLFTPDSTHGPVFAAPRFRGRSRRGAYGDSLVEVDDSIGRILAALDAAGAGGNESFVFVTSDNGAATYDFTTSGPSTGPNGGSNGMLLCGKETTFEGGMRVPAIAHWPGVVAPGSLSNEIVTLMDVFTTSLTLAGVPLPTDRIVDGVDMMPVLKGGASLNDIVFYYRGNGLFAVRQGPMKAHFWTWDNTPNATGPDNHPGDAAEFCPGQINPLVTTANMTNQTAQPLLFDMWTDPGERYPIPPSDVRYAPAIASIRAAVAAHEASLVVGAPVLNVCDDATGNWQPPGCEKQAGWCQPIPLSKPYVCPWTH